MYVIGCFKHILKNLKVLRLKTSVFNGQKVQFYLLSCKYYVLTLLVQKLYYYFCFDLFFTIHQLFCIKLKIWIEFT